MDLTVFTQAGQTLTTTYVEMGKDKIKTATSLIAKLTALKDFDLGEGDLLESDSLTDVIESAGTIIEATSGILDVLAENPLVAQFISYMESEFQWKINSPLGLVKMLIGKESSNLLKVATAMIKWPVSAAEYSARTRVIFNTLNSLLNEIPAGMGDFPLDGTSTIPDAVLTPLLSCRKLLAQSLSGVNPDLVKYRSAQTDLDTAIAALNDIEVWQNSPLGTVASMTIRLAIDQLRAQFTASGATSSMTDNKNEIISLYNTIKETPVIPAVTNPTMAKARKAKSEIDKIIRNMQNPDIVQNLALIQYAMALGAVRAVLMAATPIIVMPVLAFPNTTVVFNTAPLLKVHRDLGRVYNFLNYPNKLDLLAQLVADGLSDLNVLDAEITMFNAQLDALWLVLPGVRELIDMCVELLNKAGLDGAASALETGDISSLISMNALTGTKSGAAFAAISTIMETLTGMRISSFDTVLSKMEAKMKLESSKDQAKIKAKKKSKIEKLKANIANATQAIDESVTFMAEMSGILSGIVSMVSPPE